MTEVIPAHDVDYRNVDEVCAYQLLLCKIYECEGGFDLPAKSTPITCEIRSRARIWLPNAKSLIDSILRGGDFSEIAPASAPTLAAIPPLLHGYDILYRIANSIPCYDYLRQVKLMTADRWLRGDKSISKTDVVLLLLSEADRDIKTLEDRYAKYAVSMMTSWIDELVRNGKFSDIPLSETYRRLSYLLNADLFVYMGRKEETKAKAEWAAAHILTEEEIDAQDTDTLWAYANFIDSIPFSSQKEYAHKDTMYMHILSKISSRPDTHPYAAKAIALTSNRRAALIA